MNFNTVLFKYVSPSCARIKPSTILRYNNTFKKFHHTKMVLKATDKFATKAIHAGTHTDVHGSVIEPISLSTTFKQSSPANPVGIYEYSRSQNPNRENLENAIAALENGKYGLAFSSGSATTATVLQSLPQGSHAISCLLYTSFQ